MLLSIIIPCLNAQKYLSRCLDSVLTSVSKLDANSTEVILVDNGSSDDTLRIATSFKSQFSKAKVHFSILKCPIPGASAARNLGTKHAQGTYLWFIDADDEITPSAAKSLVETAQNSNSDITMMGATRIYSDGHTDYLSAVTPKDPNWRSRFVRYGAGPWQFIFKRSWWQKHNFRFREGIIHEDMELISSLILYTDKFSAVDQPLYLYYQNDDSVLHKKSWDPHYLDIFPALTGLYDRFKQANAVDKYHDELEWFFIWNLLIDSAKDFAHHKEGKSGFARSRALLKEYFPHWRHNQFLRAKPLRLRLRVWLNY